METEHGVQEAQTYWIEPTALELMQLNVPGQLSPQELAAMPDTTEHLRELTKRMLEEHGENAKSEYDRYIGTEERELAISPETHNAIGEMLRGKNILVTGAIGVIGGALLAELQKYAPGRIAGISRGTRVPNEDYTPVERVEYRNCDIRDKDGLRKVFSENQPDVVIHLAAERSPGKAELEPKEAISTNVFGTETLLEVMEEFADDKESDELPRYIHASTGKAVRPYSPDVYCGSKKAGELIVSRFAARMQTRGKAFLASAGRFTHNVDQSIVIKNFKEALDDNSVLSMHDPLDEFYVESAKESAQLLLLGALEAQEGELTVSAITDLGDPIRLFDVALGAIASHVGDAEAYATLENPPLLYVHGKPAGYEDEHYPGHYHPMVSGDISPLIGPLDGDIDETPKYSKHPDHKWIYQLDKFGILYIPEASTQFEDELEILLTACGMENSEHLLRSTLQNVSWAGMHARLASVPLPNLWRQIDHLTHPRGSKPNILDEHHMMDDIILRVAEQREKVVAHKSASTALASDVELVLN